MKNLINYGNNFISFKDTNEECVIYSKSNNLEIVINDKADEVIEELFESLFSRYQISLETKMNSSNFIWIMLIYYNANTIK